MKKNKAILFTLLSDGHLNSYDKQYIPNINYDDFDRLKNEINRI